MILNLTLNFYLMPDAKQGATVPPAPKPEPKSDAQAADEVLGMVNDVFGMLGPRVGKAFLAGTLSTLNQRTSHPAMEKIVNELLEGLIAERVAETGEAEEYQRNLQTLYEKTADAFGIDVAMELFGDAFGYMPEEDEADEGDAESAGGEA